MGLMTEFATAITIIFKLYIQMQGIFGGKPIEEIVIEARANNNAVLDKP